MYNTTVTVRNCGNYYVYKLPLAPCPTVGALSTTLPLRYCTANQPLTMMLVDGSASTTATMGRLQIWHGDSWGTVCDVGWEEGRTICKSLGLGDLFESYRCRDRTGDAYNFGSEPSASSLLSVCPKVKRYASLMSRMYRRILYTCVTLARIENSVT